MNNEQWTWSWSIDRTNWMSWIRCMIIMIIWFMIFYNVMSISYYWYCELYLWKVGSELVSSDSSTTVSLNRLIHEYNVIINWITVIFMTKLWLFPVLRPISIELRTIEIVEISLGINFLRWWIHFCWTQATTRNTRWRWYIKHGGLINRYTNDQKQQYLATRSTIWILIY